MKTAVSAISTSMQNNIFVEYKFFVCEIKSVKNEQVSSSRQ